MEKIKRCPFCGSEVDFMNLVLPIKMFYCKNHHGCGAVVSFDTPICNRFEKAKIDAWNRRVEEKAEGAATPRGVILGIGEHPNGQKCIDGRKSFG